MQFVLLGSLALVGAILSSQNLASGTLTLEEASLGIFLSIFLLSVYMGFRLRSRQKVALTTLSEARLSLSESQRRENQHASEVATLQAQTRELSAQLESERLAKKAFQDAQLELETKLGESQQLLAGTKAELLKLSLQDQTGESTVLLSLLQERGRFLDFVMDEVSAYSDAQVAAAARLVHQGCRSVMDSFFRIEPISSSPEGARVTLEAEDELKDVRLLGRVGASGPYSGRVIHRGWCSRETKLPKSHQLAVSQKRSQGTIQPAEVEV